LSDWPSKAGLFGAMPTAVSEALANLPKVSLRSLPRMADFAAWAQAGEAALGLQAGTFMDAYVGKRWRGARETYPCNGYSAI